VKLRYVASIREELRDRLKLGSILKGRFTDTDSVEILNAQFIGDENTIFGRSNPSHQQKQLNWHNSSSRSICDFEDPIPTHWERISSDTGKVNSNYGYLLLSLENGSNGLSQYQHCLSELAAHPSSLKALMIYQRPTMHDDAMVCGMNDFVGLNQVQVLIRKNTLVYSVFMSSCDAVYGYMNDFLWHDQIRNRLKKDLLEMTERDYNLAEVIWHVGSLYVGRNHWPEVHAEAAWRM